MNTCIERDKQLMSRNPIFNSAIYELVLAVLKVIS